MLAAFLPAVPGAVGMAQGPRCRFPFPPPPGLRCPGRSGGEAEPGPGRAGRDGSRLRCAGPRRHAVPGAGHQPAGRPAAAGAGPGAVRRRRRHLG